MIMSILMNLRADLSPAFHWNIKQLFVFVVAEYETEANVSHDCCDDKLTSGTIADLPI
jgi:Signal peptidase subunit